MAEENATLRDTTQSADAAAAAATTDSSTTLQAATTPKVADTEAADIGKLLLEAGVTRDQVPELLNAPGALNALRHLVTNNPEGFLAELEKSDPASGQKFLHSMADTYLKRNEHTVPTGSDKGKDSELVNKLNEVSRELNALKSKDAQRDAAAAIATLKSRFSARVDDMLSQKEIKELGLTKSEQKGMRARLENELANDPAAFRRIQNGNFVDVPKKFQEILDDHVSDKKTSAEAAKSARERSQSQAFNEFFSGAAPNIDAKTFDSWESTEEALARALQGAQ